MEKFPVRMKDNDLLVTQLFEDPCKEPITALSVYFTPNVCKSHLRTSLDIVIKRNGRFVHNGILGIPLLCRSIFYTEAPWCVCVWGGGGGGAAPLGGWAPLSFQNYVCYTCITTATRIHNGSVSIIDDESCTAKTIL